MNQIATDEILFRRILASSGEIRIVGCRAKSGGEERFDVEDGGEVVATLPDWPAAFSEWRRLVQQHQKIQ